MFLFTQLKTGRPTLAFKPSAFIVPELWKFMLPRLMARHFSIGTKAFAPVNVPIDLSKGTTSVHFHIPEGCKRPSDINQFGKSRFEVFEHSGSRSEGGIGCSHIIAS